MSSMFAQLDRFHSASDQNARFEITYVMAPDQDGTQWYVLRNRLGQETPVTESNLSDTTQYAPGWGPGVMPGFYQNQNNPNVVAWFNATGHSPVELANGKNLVYNTTWIPVNVTPA